MLDSPGKRVYTTFYSYIKENYMSIRKTDSYYFYFWYYFYTGLPVLR